MGRVYLATLEGAGGFTREIAVKLVRAELSASTRATDLFMREGRALASLSHRNIVQVFELASEGDVLLLAMEYVRGLDLSAIRARGPLQWAAAAFIASEAARGLAAAHAVRSGDAPNGIVHGDVSPSNVMACIDGAVKVVDFGISRPLGGGADGVRGKAPYMPPEVIIGGAADERSDVYGLGLVLYELLVGERVFRAESDPEIMQRVMHEPVPPPSTRLTGIPAALDALVMSAIARDRGARPHTASDFADALDRIVAGRFGAADLAALVDTLAERPALARGDAATPMGRTHAFGADEPTGHTISATVLPAGPSAATTAANPTKVTATRDASPTGATRSKRRGVIAVAAGTALLVGGLAIWNVGFASQETTPVTNHEVTVVPMRTSGAEAAPVSPTVSGATVVAGDSGAPAAATGVGGVSSPAAARPVAPSNAVPPHRPAQSATSAKRKRDAGALAGRSNAPTPARAEQGASAGSGGISPGYLANPFSKK